MTLKDLFAGVVNMSLTASAVILCVLIVRLGLRKAPKVFSYALWVVVLFRLLCPVSVSVDVAVPGLAGSPVKAVSENVSRVEFLTAGEEAALKPVGGQAAATALKETGPETEAVLAWVWLAGVGVMAVYGLGSLARLKKMTREAARLYENVYEADGLGTAFVMGLVRPRIYLPSGLGEEERRFVLLHEGHHLKRGDHVWKMAAFLALSVHWFNPLVWAAFLLSEKDMEMSCDEAVLKCLEEDGRCAYSQTLLRVSSGKKKIAMPLAFGEGNVKERVKHVLNWKRSRRWMTAVCGVLCVGVLVACGVNPAVETTGPAETAPTVTEESVAVETVPTEPMAAQEPLYGVRLDLTKYANIEVELPESWDYEIVEYVAGCDQCGIRFWPENCPEAAVGLYYHPQGFGVCGTGLETREATMYSGETVIMGYYDGSEMMSYCAYWNDYAAIAEGIENYPERESVLHQILLSVKLNQGVVNEQEALEAILAEEDVLELEFQELQDAMYRAEFDAEHGFWTFTFYDGDYSKPVDSVCVNWDGSCQIPDETHHSHGDHHE